MHHKLSIISFLRVYILSGTACDVCIVIAEVGTRFFVHMLSLFAFLNGYLLTVDHYEIFLISRQFFKTQITYISANKL